MNELTAFLFEMGHLKRVPRSGWALAGIDRPESVADHSFRTAVLGYVLALLEGADPAQTALICLFHDIHESRISDLHHLGQAYAEWTGTQQRAIKALLERLPSVLAEKLGSLIAEGRACESKEGRLACDADRLELLLQAIEYRAAGSRSLDGWIERQSGLMESRTAQHIAAEANKPGAQDWWSSLVGQVALPR